MPTYSNIGNMFPEQGWKAEGAAGGFLAGLQDQYSIGNADRVFRDSDLEHQMRQLKFLQEQKDQEKEDSLRSLAIKEALFKTRSYDNGMQEKLRDSNFDTTLAENAGKQTDAQTKVQKAQDQAVFDAYDAMNRYRESNKGARPPAFDKSFWGPIFKRFDETGVKYPPVPDAPFMDGLAIHGPKALRRIEHLNRMEEQAAQQASHEKIAETAARGREYAANRALEGVQYKTDRVKRDEEMLLIIERHPGPLRSIDLYTAKRLYEDKFNLGSEAKDNLVNYFLSEAEKKYSDPEKAREAAREAYVNRKLGDLVKAKGQEQPASTGTNQTPAAKGVVKNTPMPMPKKEKDLIEGVVYDTAKGLATWNGESFDLVQ